MDDKFNEEDKKRIIEFLNLIAEKAEFPSLKLTEIIKIYGSLSYMQRDLLAKVDANMLEVVAVHEAKSSEDSSESSEE